MGIWMKHGLKESPLMGVSVVENERELVSFTERVLEEREYVCVRLQYYLAFTSLKSTLESLHKAQIMESSTRAS